jgi:hypothetical protein
VIAVSSKMVIGRERVQPFVFQGRANSEMIEILPATILQTKYLVQQIIEETADPVPRRPLSSASR